MSNLWPIFNCFPLTSFQLQWTSLSMKREKIKNPDNITKWRTKNKLLDWDNEFLVYVMFSWSDFKKQRNSQWHILLTCSICLLVLCMWKSTNIVTTWMTLLTEMDGKMKDDVQINSRQQITCNLWQRVDLNSKESRTFLH